MEKSKLYLALGCAMVAIALVFLAYALQHPEQSFPWSNSITYGLYIVYLLVTVFVFFLWIKSKRS
ncbi:hypothetical protein ABB02_00105 [Clostridiaceae bacterium JG1575]|nr:hypothetical protein ABB02_00105 [Clostridiaceae bacterium JG1575]